MKASGVRELEQTYESVDGDPVRELLTRLYRRQRCDLIIISEGGREVNKAFEALVGPESELTEAESAFADRCFSREFDSEGIISFLRENMTEHVSETVQLFCAIILKWAQPHVYAVIVDMTEKSMLVFTGREDFLAKMASELNTGVEIPDELETKLN